MSFEEAFVNIPSPEECASSAADEDVVFTRPDGVPFYSLQYGLMVPLPERYRRWVRCAYTHYPEPNKVRAYRCVLDTGHEGAHRWVARDFPFTPQGLSDKIDAECLLWLLVIGYGR